MLQKNIQGLLIKLFFMFIIFSIFLMIFVSLFYSIYFNRNELREDNIELHYEDISSVRYPRLSVKFFSGKNLLQGYIYGDDSKKGTIIFAHGIESGSETYLTTIISLVDKGWRVFAFDGTGTRESEGSGIRGLPQTKIDLKFAFNYIKEKKKYNQQPVFLYGHSMGGYAVLSILAEDIDVQGVISVSPFNSPNDMIKYQSENYLGIMSIFVYPFMELNNFINFQHDANVTAVEGINFEKKIPILIICGNEDEVIPYDKVGVFAYRKEITNPNINFIIIKEKYRNKHMTTWLSSEAAQFYIEYLEQNSGEILDSNQRRQINEIDKDFLSKIDGFLEEQLTR